VVGGGVLLLFRISSRVMTAEIREIPFDAQTAQVVFRVQWFGVIPVTGRFTAVQGQLSMPRDGLDGATISVDVDAASVDSGIALRDRHLRGPRFLDSARYPFISFRSTRIRPNDGTIHVEGVLSVRGVEQTVAFHCVVNGPAGNGNGDTLSLHATMRVSRTRFGVGRPRGILTYSPLFSAIADVVRVDARVSVPAIRALPALLPALGR
jgi:polyisoprenoid-binding protein YceI